MGRLRGMRSLRPSRTASPHRLVLERLGTDWAQRLTMMQSLSLAGGEAPRLSTGNCAVRCRARFMYLIPRGGVSDTGSIPQTSTASNEDPMLRYDSDKAFWRDQLSRFDEELGSAGIEYGYPFSPKELSSKIVLETIRAGNDEFETKMLEAGQTMIDCRLRCRESALRPLIPSRRRRLSRQRPVPRLPRGVRQL